VSQRLKDIIIGIVTVVWAVNVSAPLWNKGFQSSAEVNGVFMAIVGVYFGTRSSGEKKEK
jgi:hypothetical protein